jgi:antitoxin (DNA-binding transcriptional repressor) of toxin-antitoxin stability system
MLTISTRQAVHQFSKFAKMARAGKRILVTHDGKPLVVLQPPPKAKRGRTSTKWPDYPAHWRKHFPAGASLGPTAAELLAQDKEDRF